MTEKQRNSYRADQAAQMREKGWIPPTDVAEALHMAPSTIYRLFYTEKVEGRKVGSALYLSVEDLQKHFGDQAWEESGL
jgi:hypothetical protein